MALALFGAAGTLVPVTEVGEGDAGILASAAEAEARHGEDEIHIVLFVHQEVMADLVRHRHGAVLGGARRQGDQADDKALVLARQEAGGQPYERENQHGHDAGIGQHHPAGMIDDSAEIGGDSPSASARNCG